MTSAILWSIYQLEVRKGKTIVQKNSKTKRFEKSFWETEKLNLTDTRENMIIGSINFKLG